MIFGTKKQPQKKKKKNRSLPQRTLEGQRRKERRRKAAPFLSIPNRIGKPRIREEEPPHRGKEHHHRSIRRRRAHRNGNARPAKGSTGAQRLHPSRSALGGSCISLSLSLSARRRRWWMGERRGKGKGEHSGARWLSPPSPAAGAADKGAALFPRQHRGKERRREREGKVGARGAAAVDADADGRTGRPERSSLTPPSRSERCREQRGGGEEND